MQIVETHSSASTQSLSPQNFISLRNVFRYTGMENLCY